MDWDPPDTWTEMEKFLKSVAGDAGARPKAILLVSAHWEEDAFTVGTNPAPELIFDYHGFPKHTYELTYPAPGAPELARKVVSLLKAAGIEAREDAERGYDHGVFIPLKVMYPDADIPIVTLSLKTGLDPAEHIAAGRALESLRSEGVMIVGSGMSYHNLRKFFGGTNGQDAEAFDEWLQDAANASSEKRAGLLSDWANAPAARSCHPREEHLLPLMVVAGAAGDDAGKTAYSDKVMGLAVSGYRFG